MIGPDRRRPLAFVADLDAPALESDDRHHLERVLRLRDGDEFTVSDGAGRFRTVRFGKALDPTSAIEALPRPEPALTVGIALAKGDKPEVAVQKLTEVGIDRIVPFVAAHSVVRWDEAKAARNATRWSVIARAAAAQSRRAWLPEVAAVATFADVAAIVGVALADPDGEPLAGQTALLIGPEGGWAPDEEASIECRVCLSPHVLRAETAAIVAGVLLVSARAGLR